MTTLLRGWRQIEQHPQNGERWFGWRLIQSYLGDDLYRSPDLGWFRDAVRDVRTSLNPGGGELLVRELHIYEDLASLPAVVNGGWMRSIMSRLNPPLKRRKGMVCYADPPAPSKLYLSRSGRDTPRVVYEEVAHCLMRSLPIESSDRRPDDLEGYARALLSSNPQFRPNVVYWPIVCHLDIFRGFINDSEAYRNSSEEDRQFAHTQVVRLEGMLRCRRLGIRNRSECPCPP